MSDYLHGPPGYAKPRLGSDESQETYKPPAFVPPRQTRTPWCDRVVAYLERCEGPASISDICREIDIDVRDPEARNRVSGELSRLVKMGRIVRTGRAMYAKSTGQTESEAANPMPGGATDSARPTQATGEAEERLAPAADEARRNAADSAEPTNWMSSRGCAVAYEAPTTSHSVPSFEGDKEDISTTKTPDPLGRHSPLTKELWTQENQGSGQVGRSAPLERLMDPVLGSLETAAFHAQNALDAYLASLADPKFLRLLRRVRDGADEAVEAYRTVRARTAPDGE